MADLLACGEHRGSGTGEVNPGRRTGCATVAASQWETVGGRRCRGPAGRPSHGRSHRSPPDSITTTVFRTNTAEASHRGAAVRWTVHSGTARLSIGRYSNMIVLSKC